MCIYLQHVAAGCMEGADLGTTDSSFLQTQRVARERMATATEALNAMVAEKEALVEENEKLHASSDVLHNEVERLRGLLDGKSEGDAESESSSSSGNEILLM